MQIKISPSLLSADICNMQKDFEILNKKNIEIVHIDLMDGHFVPNITFGIYQIEKLRKLTKAEFDVHIMVENPDMYIKPLAEAGADAITVHQEAAPHIYRTITEIQKNNMKAGVALNPATPVENLGNIFEMLDRILVMSVEPGFGGQKFIDFSRKKIEKLRKIKRENTYKYVIQVDGGINSENIGEVIRCGAEDIVIGSSLFNGNLEENIDTFMEKIKRAI